MSNLVGRLQKLEAHATDRSGFAPQSGAWLGYWLCRVTRILSGEEPAAAGCIPLAVWDAITAEFEDDGLINAGSRNLTYLEPVRRAGRRNS